MASIIDIIIVLKKFLDIIKKNKYGKVLWIRSRYGKPIDNNYLKGWRGNKKKSGGGILFDQGIHVLDLIILLLGKIVKVKSILNNNFIKKILRIMHSLFLKIKNKQLQFIQHLHSGDIYLQLKFFLKEDL